MFVRQYIALIFIKRNIFNFIKRIKKKCKTIYLVHANQQGSNVKILLSISRNV